MELKALDRFNEIVIQMHDNPDADAVGSAYAIYRYLVSKGKDVRIVYSGRFKINKSNMVLFIEELEIPVEYVEDIGNPELLLTIDCQYGEGNVTPFKARNVAMIDHHNTGRVSDDMCEIRSNIVSCTAVCFDMLRSEGVMVAEDVDIATALYYGLYMDSNGLSELRHPIEMDMLEELVFNEKLVQRLVNSNFSMKEMETAGIAMLRSNYDENKRLSIIHSKPCDPNILGVIGDFLLQVDAIDVCVVFNECPGGYKLSIRSCIREISANDLASFLTEDIGDGGGHTTKAGGFIGEKRFEEKYGHMGIDAYFFNRVNKYYDGFELINAEKGIKNKRGFSLYKKKPVNCGYVKMSEFLPEGALCRLRTLEGDVQFCVTDELYIMIGLQGEAYPIERRVFETKYKERDVKYDVALDYAPTLKLVETEEIFDLTNYIKSCVSKDRSRIYAKCLTKPAKVFTKWDYDKYMIGNVGDYLCYLENDEHDIYVAKGEVFDATYKIVVE